MAAMPTACFASAAARLGVSATNDAIAAPVKMTRRFFMEFLPGFRTAGFTPASCHISRRSGMSELALSGFDANDGRIIDPRQEHRNIVSLQIFIHRLARALPAEIVIDDQNS